MYGDRGYIQIIALKHEIGINVLLPQIPSTSMKTSMVDVWNLSHSQMERIHSGSNKMSGLLQCHNINVCLPMTDGNSKITDWLQCLVPPVYRV